MSRTTLRTATGRWRDSGRSVRHTVRIFMQEIVEIDDEIDDFPGRGIGVVRIHLPLGLREVRPRLFEEAGIEFRQRHPDAARRSSLRFDRRNVDRLDFAQHRHRFLRGLQIQRLLTFAR